MTPPVTPTVTPPVLQSSAAMASASGASPGAAGMRAGVGGFVRRLIREKPLGAVGGGVFLFFLVCGLFAQVLAPYGANDADLTRRLLAPSMTHPFGTDNLGRDVFSRVLLGAQVSMVVAVTAAGLATVVSVLIGFVGGYFGGRTDMLIQRMVDAWMTFPDLVLLIVVVSIVGPGMMQIVVVLGLLYGIGGSRIVRGAVMQVRETMYTRAALSLGASPLHVLWTHVLPNVAPVLIVLFTTRLGAVILAEAGLSFLGLGVPPPAPTWGGMLSGSGRSYMFLAPWLALAPGLCLTIVVYSVNIFGDALRDLLDPRMRGAR